MFNKETEYALRGMVYIQARNIQGFRPGIAEIANEIEAPQFFTAKILQKLVRYGFLGSIKGKGGGFYFNQDNADLTLRELIIATGGRKIFVGCGFGLKSCDDDNPCPIHNEYAPIREAINNLVSTQTIQSLAKKYINSGKLGL